MLNIDTVNIFSAVPLTYDSIVVCEARTRFDVPEGDPYYICDVDIWIVNVTIRLPLLVDNKRYETGTKFDGVNLTLKIDLNGTVYFEDIFTEDMEGNLFSFGLDNFISDIQIKSV